LGSPTTILRIGSLSASTATSTDIWQRNAEQKRRNERHKCVLNATRRGTLPETVKESKQWRREKSRRNQTMKTTRKKSRVLAMIPSRHGTRDLPCKVPE